MDTIGVPRRLHAHVVDALVPRIVGGQLEPGSLLPTGARNAMRVHLAQTRRDIIALTEMT